MLEYINIVPTNSLDKIANFFKLIIKEKGANYAIKKIYQKLTNGTLVYLKLKKKLNK